MGGASGTGTIRYVFGMESIEWYRCNIRYGRTVQYLTENRVVIHSVFLFACWGGFIVCARTFESGFWVVCFAILLFCLECCRSILY